MNKTNLILSTVLVLFSLSSCKETNEFDYPLVFTGDVINITDSSAIFTAQVSNYGKYRILESGFIWGVHSNDKDGILIKNVNNKDKYSLKTNVKLLKGRTYYARAFVKTESAITYGREVSFKSLGEEQINAGKWSLHYNSDPIVDGCGMIVSNFTINDTTYLIFGEDYNNKLGSLYSYNHITNSFKYLLTNTILFNAQYSVVYNNKAYIFSNDAFYIYEPTSRSFNKLATINDGKSRYRISGFLIDDNIYIGLGISSQSEYFKDFWKYNITTNTWQKVADFPGQYREYAFSFNLNKRGYVGGGFNLIYGQWPYPKFNDLWCYISETNQWIQKTSLPFVNEELFDLKAINNNNLVYAFYKKQLYEYNPTFDIWEKRADLPSDIDLCRSHLIAINNKLYNIVATTGSGKYFKMWAYEK